MCEPLDATEPPDTDGLDRWFFGGTPPPGEFEPTRRSAPRPRAEPQAHVEPQPA